MISQIKSIHHHTKEPDAYYGFIRTTDSGKDYWFKKDDINLPINAIAIGYRVEFTPVEEGGKRYATKVRLLKEEPAQRSSLPGPSVSLADYTQNLVNAVNQINQVTECADFEDTVFTLLKLLGIHKIFQFNRNDQAGKADGFFMLENLAVMYDCTLQRDFESFKEEQIENYTNKLNQKSQITFDIKKIDGGIAPKTIQITGKTKQVWIITKGESKEIRDFDSIKIKEISIYDLLAIFAKRITDNAYDIERLVNDLIFIGK